MSQARQKGTRAETAFVRYVRSNGFGQADRIPRKGKLDEGDVTLCPGVMVELKNQPSKYNPNRTPVAWLEETEVERQRRQALFGLLVVKPTGIGYGDAVADWHAWVLVDDLWTLSDAQVVGVGTPSLPARLRVADALTLLRLGGYGDPL